MFYISVLTSAACSKRELFKMMKMLGEKMRWERYGILYIKKKTTTTVILSSTVSSNQGWNNGFLIYTFEKLIALL